MAKQFVTGPGFIFVGTGNNYSLEYLGMAEKHPKILLRPNFQQTFTDESGTVPYDASYGGEEGFVMADISKFNEPIYAKLAQKAGNRLVRGVENFGDIGALMVAEGRTFPLVVAFPYASKVAFADMPLGYRFVASYLLGPDELEPLGTTPRKIRLIWHSLRLHYGQNEAMEGALNLNIPAGSNILYDHNCPTTQQCLQLIN